MLRPREVARVATVVAPLGAVLLLACALTTPLDGLSDEYGKGNAQDGGGGGADEDRDAPVAPDGAPGPDAAPRPDGAPVTPDAALGESNRCDAGLCDLLESKGDPMGVAVDGEHLYWVDVKARAVLRTPRAGGVIEAVTEGGDDVRDPFDVAVDDRFVYWSELTPNAVWRKPRAGGAKERVFTGAGRAAFLAVANGRVFATDFRADADVGQVVAGDGTKATADVLYPSQPRAAGIAVRGDELFWATSGSNTSSVLQGTTNGGAQPTTVVAAATRITGLAADRNNLFFLDDGRRIVRQERSGQRGTLLEVNDFGGGDLAADDVAIYWTERGTGKVRRMTK